MGYYFPKSKSLGTNLKAELDLPNYATKANVKNAAGVVDTLNFPKKYDLANLKPDVDKSHIGKLKNLPTQMV